VARPARDRPAGGATAAGFSHACNLDTATASGDLLAFVDDDAFVACPRNPDSSPAYRLAKPPGTTPAWKDAEG